jgi:hypothetical protein
MAFYRHALRPIERRVKRLTVCSFRHNSSAKLVELNLDQLRGISLIAARSPRTATGEKALPIFSLYSRGFYLIYSQRDLLIATSNLTAVVNTQDNLIKQLACRC